jgi:hypothetical protein
MPLKLNQDILCERLCFSLIVCLLVEKKNKSKAFVYTSVKKLTNYKGKILFRQSFSVIGRFYPVST